VKHIYFMQVGNFCFWHCVSHNRNR